MVTLTYLLVVLGVGVALWWFGRSRAGRLGGRLRAFVLGVPGPDDDLVERMADCLVANTTVFGSSYAIPGHLGAELPGGVYEAATAARPQLTAEVLARYCETMVERSRRLGRGEFVLPESYTLRLALACGPDEVLVASFEPIVDVRGPARRPVPVPTGMPDLGDRTLRRVPPPSDDGPTRPGHDDLGGATRRRGIGTLVELTVDGRSRGTSALGAGSPLVVVGRGDDAGLRCPDDLDEVSRRHAELTWVRGTCQVEDLHSANGTWVERAGGETELLAPGTPTALAVGDVVWLDEQRLAQVSLR
ncbi:FHA domain-containing protein [Actinomycetospora termitidis]|uniref:FHA domain-containing protein n=1 Tax=Actinomycetospora termitidis TaxID=3053470 RepID=A0ABT7MDM4_9PSEU|nr:FHA domain-containing protein [Actinomycetospora sp. Odt1-22]MDL5158082.1 FHA domain-containing protein [Actinomycetospora sp. Odt1-22]